jgi:arabinosaccharide transport system substrate-binding protein
LIPLLIIIQGGSYGKKFVPPRVFKVVWYGCWGSFVVGLCAGRSAPAAETKATEAPKPTEAPASKAAAPIDLSFWTFINDHADFHKARVEAWNGKNPERQITLNASTLPYEDMHNKLLLSLQSGTGAPDLVDIEISRFGNYLKGDDSAIGLVDLVDIINKDKDQLMPQRVNVYSKAGHYYGAPTHLGASLMYYNGGVLKNAGVDIDKIKTWDDFIQAGKEVTKGDVFMTVIDNYFQFCLLAGMNGGGLMDKDGNLVLYRPENVEALRFIQDLIFKHKIAKINPGPGLDSPESYAIMNKGDVAAVWAPEWFVGRYATQMPDLKGKMRVRPVPPMKPGGYTAAMGGGTGTAITKQIAAEKRQTALDYLEFAKLSLEGNLAIWKTLHFDPFRFDAYDDPSMNDPDPVFSGEKIMQVIKAEAKNLAPHYVGPKYPQVSVAINEIVTQDAFVKNLDADEILKRVQQQVESQP